jgi:hypothetical protein
MAETSVPEQRAYHRPISVTVETVEPMPIIRQLPQDTQMTINFKGDEKMGQALIAEINKQIANGGHFAITITGRS